MQLEDVRPVMGSFKLDCTGEREYKMRKFSLDDQVWMKEQFNCRLDELVQKEDAIMVVESLSRLAYRLIEDKEQFKVRDVKIVDEDGAEQVELLGGFRLFKRMICGPIDQKNVIDALAQTVGASNPPIPVEKKTEQREKRKSKIPN